MSEHVLFTVDAGAFNRTMDGIGRPDLRLDAEAGKERTMSDAATSTIQPEKPAAVTDPIPHDEHTITVEAAEGWDGLWNVYIGHTIVGLETEDDDWIITWGTGGIYTRRRSTLERARAFIARHADELKDGEPV